MQKPNPVAARLVKELRLQRGWSVDLCAYFAGVSTRTLILLEKHGLPPKRLESRERIARALGVSERELFGETSEGMGTP
ncbi:MAG: helix-turn-helix domain-containing protein [Fimbriimonadales bacterium]